ncbi:anthranilate synthase component I family protein [Amnibacterium setariae]|uniref:Anthranilate synthase component I family protein n=1 Tax=Amnibacterium setariae TaxID=2306585 RepID=A0A3A1TYI5_9MICO|nr:anthranilate synthase component I family protein [Amnibacterium setariae]
MVPAVRVELPGPLDPAVVFRALAARHPDLVWADGAAGEPGFIGLPDGPPVVVVVVGTASPSALDALLDRLRTGSPRGVASPRLGWWGWFGYEVGAAAEDVPVAADASPAAAFLLASVGVELAADGAAAVVALPGREAAAHALAAALAPLAGAPAPEPRTPAPPAWRWRHDRTSYLRMVEDCRRAITAGDAYQLCLTNRITADLPEPLDPVEVLLALRDAAPLAGAGVLRISGWTLVAASPETLLAVDADGAARSRPIKGTRPRGDDAAADRALAEELRTDEKERAENVMIVDLVRNDLARVARTGSVAVPELLVVESYATVHQLVSTVTAQLAGGPSARFDAVRALLPAGSMTGAPKRSAMRILADLEAGPRGVYSGAWGRFGADGTAHLAVVIRSVLLHGRTAVIGTGGGITILSDPAREWRELEVKAARVLRAIGVRDPFPAP